MEISIISLIISLLSLVSLALGIVGIPAGMALFFFYRSTKDHDRKKYLKIGMILSFSPIVVFIILKLIRLIYS